MPTNRACPICATVTPLAVCPNHGKSMVIPTLTLYQLKNRYARFEAGRNGVMKAIRALQGYVPEAISGG